MFGLSLIVCLLAFFVLSYHRASLIVWTIAVAALLFTASILGHIHWFVLSVSWLVFAVVAVCFNVKAVRAMLFSKLILKLYRKLKPSISDTEREALEAGTLGWEAEFFTGKPDWDKLSAIPAAELTQEEKTFIDGPVEKLCQMLDNWKISHQDLDLPPEVWQFIKENGFLGMIIPKKYGGLEFSAFGHAEVLVKIASMNIALGTVVSVPNSLGPAELLLEYGTKEQKEYYLPRLAKGEDIPCFALTSERAGSDAGSIVDYGVVCKGRFEGKQVLGIKLNWDKRYITLSPIATLIGLAFKLYDPNGLLGEQEDLGITCALIPANTKGVTTGRRHFPVHSVFPNGPIQGKDVFIPLGWIIGGVEQAGNGWKMLMECLAAGRSISLPSMAMGGIKSAFYATGAYARIRKQFNVAIGEFGGVAQALARVGGLTYLAEAARTLSLASLDQGDKSAVISAICKYHVTEIARKVTNDAMDIHGGKAICLGPKNYMAQGYEAVPISITVEGANILTRSMIIFGQGAMRCHPYIFKEMEAANNRDEKQALKDFDQAIFAHVGQIISNKSRAFLLGLSGGYFHMAKRGIAKRYYRQLTRFASAFAYVTDVSMITLGAKLKRMETISARLGDLLSYLYMGSALIKYFEVQSCSKEEKIFLDWGCQYVLYQLQRRMDEFLLNFPNRFVALCMRVVVFPLGRRLKPPSDKLNKKIADFITHPSIARNHLGLNSYLTPNKNNPVGIMQQVLMQAVEVEPLEKKIHKAFRSGKVKGITFAEQVQSAEASGVLTAKEAEKILAYDKKRMEVIAVDDFDFSELVRGVKKSAKRKVQPKKASASKKNDEEK